MARKRYTDEMSEFDIRQMLLFEEGILRYRPTLGRAAAREKAAQEMPLIFDSTGLDAPGPMYPSILASVLGGLSRRKDWPSRRQAFTGPARANHIVEAQRRFEERNAGEC